jgi:hypothetical protein
VSNLKKLKKVLKKVLTTSQTYGIIKKKKSRKGVELKKVFQEI